MDKEETKKRYKQLCRTERTFLAEVYEVCNNLNSDVFGNLFKIGDLSERDFFCIVDFLYHNDCFVLLYQMMASYPERFMCLDLLVSRDTEVRDDLEERLERFLKHLPFFYPCFVSGCCQKPDT